MCTRWTCEEEAFLNANYNQMTNFELGEKINRTELAIEKHLRKMGLSRDFKHKSQTKNKQHKYSFVEIKLMFEQRGYELISEEPEYKSMNSKLRYKCKKHGEFQIDLSHFIRGQGCPICGQEKAAKGHMSKITPEEDRKLCEKYGFEYVKTERIDNIIYLYFICNKHRDLGIQRMRRGNIKRGITGCQYCSGKNYPTWYFKKLYMINIQNMN